MNLLPHLKIEIIKVKNENFMSIIKLNLKFIGLNMKPKRSSIFLYLLVLISINSMAITMLIPSNTTISYPYLSSYSDGVSNYNITQNVKYQVVINFSLSLSKPSSQMYYFKVARLNDRQPNSLLTPYCPPYQESELLYNSITGWDSNEMGSLDKFNNTYDLFNATLSGSETIRLNQKYNITLNEIKFSDIQDEVIGTYNPGDDIHTLFNVTEEYYECNDPTLVACSNSIVNPTDNPIEKARDIFNWIVNNIDYQEQNDEIGALEAYTKGYGDCSEFSDLMITLLRIQSIPARKVTGFLITNNPSSKPKTGKSYTFDINYNGLTQTVSSTNEILGHAWVEYYVPNIGWIACDPTWGKGYFNQIDFLRFNLNIGAWFFLPGATPPNDYISEFPINPSPVCSDHTAYNWQYSIEITVLETNLIPSPPFPIFVVIFIVIGLAVILIVVILLVRRGGKKEVFSY